MLVLLTCGLYGRQADGAYFGGGAAAYTQLKDEKESKRADDETLSA